MMMDDRMQKKLVDGMYRLRNHCNVINQVLCEAEDNWVIEKKSTKRWLYRLKLFSAKAEDLIEEYSYEIIREQEESSKTSTSFLECIWVRLNEMENEFESISNDRELDLKNDDGEKIVPVPSRHPSSALNENPCIYGREKDIKNIVEMLINPNRQQIQNPEQDITATVINMVGMGGIGKTSIAQEIYKDKKIINHFQCRAWVCVSDEFQIEVITKEALLCMIEDGKRKKVENLTVFSVIQEVLQNELVGRRFFLVLDDVWNEIQHVSDTLGFLQNLGSPNSKILVTTRSKVVAGTMFASLDYSLGPLSFTFGWELFRNHALTGTIHESNQELLGIGRKIVEKCKGLPLMIKVLGDLLRDANGDEERWSDVLRKNTMEIMDKNGESTIFKTLNSSYINLPSLLKRCFLYCSVFPKDHMFDREDLIRMWVAQDILKDEKPLMECVDGLFHRSFLQKQFYNGKVKYVLHDLMHDLAQHILREENLLISDNSRRIMQDNFCYIEPIIGRTFHHSLYQSPHRIEIETLHLNLKHLRVLIWRDEVANSLPDMIGELKHLRYLRLDMPNVEYLPESVCNLYNLWTLDCDSLLKLPQNIRKLRNLRHIISTNYVCIPVGMGELIHLQTSPKFVVINKLENHGGLAELKNLSSLSGSLVLMKLNNEYISDKDNMVKLYEKPHLKELQLQWEFLYHSDVSAINLLSNFRPHINLIKLEVESYNGIDFPDWLGCSRFSNLTHVTLSRCIYCETLPPLGQLKSLKVLLLIGLSNVKRIGVEFYGGGKLDENLQISSFQSLEQLVFSDMHRWKEWWECDRCLFPSLKTVKFFGCHKLRLSVVPKLFSRLEFLYVDRYSPHIFEMCKALELKYSK